MSVPERLLRAEFRDSICRIRLEIPRTRDKLSAGGGLRRFERRAEEVLLLMREALFRKISTRQ